MKKLMTLLVAMVAMFALAACTNNNEGDQPVDVVFEQLEGRVEEVEESRVLVESELGPIWFSYDNTSDLEAGDVIEITYEAGLAESYPMQGVMVEYEMVMEYVAPSIDYTTSEILNKIINNSGAELYGMEDVITEDNIQWLLGSTEYPEFIDTAVYYPMMSTDVSMLVVFEVNEEDVEATKEALMNNIDPNRLVCVTFDMEEDVVVDSFGNKVVLIINKAFKVELHEAFLGLVEEAEAGNKTVEGIVVEVMEADENWQVIVENGEFNFDFLTDSELTEIGVGDELKVVVSKRDNMMVSFEMIKKYSEGFELTASEIIQSLVNDSGAEFGGSFEGVIDESNQQWYLGAGEYPEFLDTAVYAPMMNVDVSLIVVLKVEAEQVEDLKTTIMGSIDPMRLVCVSFDLEEDVVVDSFGDTVVLIINKQFKEEIHNQFVALQ